MRASSRIRTALILLLLFLLLDLTVGLYHITHGGFGSGPIQLLLAIVFGSLGYLIFQAERHGDTTKSYRLRRLLLVIIVVVAAIILFLSIYHFTHEGTPSGSIELVMTVLLVTIGYFIMPERFRRAP